MSENHIRMVALVGGKITSVGTCHPGQARLLKKQGMAEWKDGKLWLRNPVQDTPPEELAKETPFVTETPFAERVGADTRDRVVAHIKNIPSHIRDIPPHIKEEVDPDGSLGREKAFEGDPVQVICQAAQDFIVHLLARKQEGHELIWHDDPKGRRMGFLDHTTHEWVLIGLSAAKNTWGNVQVEGMSLERLGEKVFTRIAERGLIPTDQTGFTYHEDTPPSDVEVDPELEALWDVPPKHPSNATVSRHVIHLDEDESGAVDFSLNIEGIRSVNASAVMRRCGYKRSVLGGWTQFSWPHDKNTVPVHNLEADGSLTPFPAFPEGATAEGMFYRTGNHLLRVWHTIRGGETSLVWDESRIHYTEDRGMVYVMVSATTRPDGKRAEAIKQAEARAKELQVG